MLYGEDTVLQMHPALYNIMTQQMKYPYFTVFQAEQLKGKEFQPPSPADGVTQHLFANFQGHAVKVVCLGPF